MAPFGSGKRLARPEVSIAQDENRKIAMITGKTNLHPALLGNRMFNPLFASLFASLLNIIFALLFIFQAVILFIKAKDIV
jgi:hypothetical protein